MKLTHPAPASLRSNVSTKVLGLDASTRESRYETAAGPTISVPGDKLPQGFHSVELTVLKDTVWKIPMGTPPLNRGPRLMVDTFILKAGHWYTFDANKTRVDWGKREVDVFLNLELSGDRYPIWHAWTEVTDLKFHTLTGGPWKVRVWTAAAASEPLAVLDATF